MDNVWRMTVFHGVSVTTAMWQKASPVDSMRAWMWTAAVMECAWMMAVVCGVSVIPVTRQRETGAWRWFLVAIVTWMEEEVTVQQSPTVESMDGDRPTEAVTVVEMAATAQ
jgi:hypothetical protein